MTVLPDMRTSIGRARRWSTVPAWRARAHPVWTRGRSLPEGHPDAPRSSREHAPPPKLPSLIAAVVDDDPLTREALRNLLGASFAIRAWEEYSEVDAALVRLPHVRPDVVLVEASLASEGQGATFRALVAAMPASHVLAFGHGRKEEEIFHVIDAGASGYLIRSDLKAELPAAIRRARAGQRLIPPEVERRLKARLARRALTPRELEVLQLLAAAHCNSTIATLLRISIGTVKLHVKSVLAKLEVEDRTAAILTAWERGYVRVR